MKLLLASARMLRPGPPAAPVRSRRISSDNGRSDLSMELPVQMKEWSSSAIVVPNCWRPDGVITAREKGDDDGMEDGLATRGSIVRVSMDSPASVRTGDYLVSYLNGGRALDKAGKNIGREIQQTGLLEVVEVKGRKIRARVLKCVTGIDKGQLVRKK